MAYYTIANYLHEDIYGLHPKNGILPEMLTEEVFDYISNYCSYCAKVFLLKKIK